MRTTDHFDGTRFFNPTHASGQPVSAVPRMLAETRVPWPDAMPVTPERPPAIDNDAWGTVTFVGHSTFLIQTRAGNVLTDPMFSERAGPLSFIGPRRVRAPGVRFDDLPDISLVLLSHNHYDHCDLRTLAALQRRFDLELITMVGNAALARKARVRRIEELDWWQPTKTSSIAVTATPAQHFSARTPFDRNRALWGGFVVEVAGRRIFFAGDSGYAPHFADVPRRLGDIDLALLPIGAYEPRWFMKDVHMNPDEAVRAHLDLGARRSIGMHFGTFHLTAEAIDQPLADLDAARRAHAVSSDQFTTLGFGGSLHLT
jgi:L-ascorbate metabolism protein UlaG (beta-lactamase superfamily)